ncbi:hypothetical protein FB563_1786 [Streptomyces puniciscabiei]|uniref:Uncharacterized protein n=1 Tax=Streptomyces puniciscabiei TaxID=164348 RepID=A0A542UCN9_9ACTN|nr:hypothetical protein [Streptomyces puniciscabiei]TQK96834.1 hypothetical protein FB563_1786 [Streptomyces puniciscabiei]
MDTPRAEPGSVLPRLLGAAATGALLATGADRYLSWAIHRNDLECETVDTLCFTWWGLTAVPLVLTVSAIVLSVVYKRLDIRPRLAIVPPTVLLGVIPLSAAQVLHGRPAVALTGGAWACSLALAAWQRHRVPAFVACTALLLAALTVLYG